VPLVCRRTRFLSLRSLRDPCFDTSMTGVQAQKGTRHARYEKVDDQQYDSVTKAQVATPDQAEVVPSKVSTHYAHTMAKKKRAASPPASFVAMKKKK